AQRLEEQGEVLLVLRAILDPRDSLSRIFPIDVDPIQLVIPNELHGAAREFQSRGLCQGGIGESISRPTADGNDDFQLRVLRLQRIQGTQILRSQRELECNTTMWVNVGERKVDMGQLFRMDTR